MIFNYNRYRSYSYSPSTSPSEYSKDVGDFALLFTLRESRRTSDSALSRDHSKQLRFHPWRLDSEALRLLQRWGIFFPPLFQYWNPGPQGWFTLIGSADNKASEW